MIKITAQTTDYNCGPTALAAAYSVFEDFHTPDTIGKRLEYFTPEHGTYDVALALDALVMGYDVTMHVYNMNIFDYTWHNNTDELIQHLEMMRNNVIVDENTAYQIGLFIEFLKKGGHINISPNIKFVLSEYVSDKRHENVAMICGISATTLYHCSRVDEFGNYSLYGKPEGHFVVMDIDDAWNGNPTIYDPYGLKSCFGKLAYSINLDTFYQALLQGTHTNDGTIIIIKEKQK